MNNAALVKELHAREKETEPFTRLGFLYFYWYKCWEVVPEKLSVNKTMGRLPRRMKEQKGKHLRVDQRHQRNVDNNCKT